MREGAGLRQGMARGDPGQGKPEARLPKAERIPKGEGRMGGGAACFEFKAWPGRFLWRSSPCRSRRSLEGVVRFVVYKHGAPSGAFLNSTPMRFASLNPKGTPHPGPSPSEGERGNRSQPSGESSVMRGGFARLNIACLEFVKWL